MKTRTIAGVVGAALLAAGMQASPVHAAAGTADLGCKLHFSLTGWSVIYKHAEGRGTVTCADGSSMPVVIDAKGAGLTVGKARVDNGTGRFSNVFNITDVLGRYAEGEAHAGIVKSGNAQVVTKGTVSLALAGAGEGVDLGVDVGEFTISEPATRR
ncbi:MAG TPA: hypothetical protein VFB32_11080 [Rudaea sp.]|nr:hypothetical protein [Rudaea sp.]